MVAERSSVSRRAPWPTSSMISRLAAASGSSPASTTPFRAAEFGSGACRRRIPRTSRQVSACRASARSAPSRDHRSARVQFDLDTVGEAQVDLLDPEQTRAGDRFGREDFGERAHGGDCRSRRDDDKRLRTS